MTSNGPERESRRGQELGSAGLTALLAWLSPAYPVGAFSYSSGIEWAVEAGDIKSVADFHEWLDAVIAEGSGFCDAVIFTHAHRAADARDHARMQEVAELAAAYAASKERHLETTAQGRAFLQTTDAAWPSAALGWFRQIWSGEIAYPVAVAVACAGQGIGQQAGCLAFLQAVAANLISAGVRLVPLGQTDGQKVLAGLAPRLEETARQAALTPLEEIGSAAFRADLASMHHETQYTRLFRS